MIKTLICATATLLLAALPVSGHAAEYTTISETAQIAIGLDFHPPSSYYEFDGTTLSWTEPGERDSHYMCVSLSDMVSSTPLPGCTITAVFTTNKDKLIGTSVTLHETWDQDHPHYGVNLQMPEGQTSGNVTLKIDPAKGRRLGRTHGNFFTKSVTVNITQADFTLKVPVRLEPEIKAPIKVEWPEGRRPYANPTPYPGSH